MSFIIGKIKAADVCLQQQWRIIHYPSQSVAILWDAKSAMLYRVPDHMLAYIVAYAEQVDDLKTIIDQARTDQAHTDD